MKLAFGTVLVLTVMLSRPAGAEVHCYSFRNDSAGVATLTFAYSPAIGNVVTGVAIDPGKTYPFDGRPWCWNLSGYTAAVTVSGSGLPGWADKLVLGNGAHTADSGTYVLTATTAATAAVAAAPAARAAAPAAATQTPACLPNSYPNNGSYCLTALQTGIQVRCGTGHTGRSGTLTVDYLDLTCANGRKFRLACMNVTGGRQQCDLNDHEMCTDESPRSAADFCGHSKAQAGR
jgi:hypothetical protein